MQARVLWGWGIAALALVPVAQGGLWQDLYRGLGFVALPSGDVTVTQDGTAVNGQRLGRLAITPNVPGRGYNLEFDRSFGPDSTNRDEILDLGPFELELDGDIAATLGYTSRGFLIGNANLTSDLDYTIRGKTGAQDFELSGNLSILNNLEINQFGFYTVEVNMRNRDSQLLLDGVLVRDIEDLSSDIGPITLEGNIFFDGLVGLLGAMGADTSGLAGLSPKSPIDQIVDSIQGGLRLDEIAPADKDSAALSAGLLRAALTPGASDPQDLQDVIARVAAAAASDVVGPHPGGSTSVVPEPAAGLALLALAGMGAAARRR